MRPTFAEINLDNFIFNLNQLKNKLGANTKLMAVIKANAYGHGALKISRVALNNGADSLGVALLEEAMELKEEGINAPILVFGYISSFDLEKAIERKIRQTVFSYQQALSISRAALNQNKEALIHIKIDTGMRRIGFWPERKSLEEIEEIYRLPGIKVEGFYTHFACAEKEDKSYTQEQMHRFLTFIKALKEQGFEPGLLHTANSAALIDLPSTHLDLVRPGIALYGLYPSFVQCEKIELKTVLSLKSEIIQLKVVPAGSGISYNHTFRTSHQSIIATLPIGYADGLNRRLSNKGEVLVKGKKVPIVGTICMDQCLIDVSSINDVEVGDEAVLLGAQGREIITADEIADRLGTISYEVLTSISNRVPRLYKGFEGE